MDEIQYKKYIAVTVPYSGALSLLYLWGYWGTFNFNFLEFIGFSDLAKLALYPFLGSFISFLIGSSISQVLLRGALPPGGGANTNIGKFGRKYWRHLVALNLILIYLSAIFLSAPQKWLLVAFLVSLFSAPLSHLEFFISLIPNPSARSTILYLLLIAGGMTLFYGNYDAHLVKTGYGPQLIDVARSKLPLQSDEKNPVTYLGHVSEYLALYESATRSVILVKAKDDSPLFLFSNPKRKSSLF